MINLELNMRDGIILRHALFMHIKDHPGFFSDERILTIREISQELDREIEKEFDILYEDENQ